MASPALPSLVISMCSNPWPFVLINPYNCSILNWNNASADPIPTRGQQGRAGQGRWLINSIKENFNPLCKTLYLNSHLQYGFNLRGPHHKSMSIFPNHRSRIYFTSPTHHPWCLCKSSLFLSSTLILYKNCNCRNLTKSAPTCLTAHTITTISPEGNRQCDPYWHDRYSPTTPRYLTVSMYVGHRFTNAFSLGSQSHMLGSLCVLPRIPISYAGVIKTKTNEHQDV